MIFNVGYIKRFAVDNPDTNHLGRLGKVGLVSKLNAIEAFMHAGTDDSSLSSV